MGSTCARAACVLEGEGSSGLCSRTRPGHALSQLLRHLRVRRLRLGEPAQRVRLVARYAATELIDEPVDLTVRRHHARREIVY